MTWKAAGIPPKDMLKAITINGYKAADIYNERGPIKVGNYADLIAVPGNPLEDIDALRNVQFVMKNGAVFKKDGIVTVDKLSPSWSDQRLQETMTWSPLASPPRPESRSAS